jgi:3-phenylpropionate/cinnamic acid dioxygenase small subunit
MRTTPGDRELIDFVIHEARLLDDERWDDWLELFAEDGVYWMPLAPGQTDARLHASLLHEDLLLLRIRIERLKGPRTYSQQPPSRGHHLLQVPTIESRDDAEGVYVTRTAFHFVETRRDEQALYAGWAWHTLIATDAGLKLRMKRVDLVNCDAAFGNMQLLM